MRQLTKIGEEEEEEKNGKKLNEGIKKIMLLREGGIGEKSLNSLEVQDLRT